MTVLCISDNTSTVHELHKGYSTTEGRFVSEFLAQSRPGLTITAEWHEGATIPSDELTRGRALNRAKLDALARSKALEVRGIREVAL